MMATSENGTDMSNDIDIDALIMPDVNESEVSAVVDSLQQELAVGSSVTSLPQHSQVNQTNIANSSNLDLIKTIKTEGESSDRNKTSTSAQLTLNLSSSTTLSDSSRRQSISLMSPFSGIAPQTPLTPNSQILSSEEQAAIHKQAGLLAIHTYCSKHGQAKAKEILDGVTKVKNFLTNLIQLAAKSGPQVHGSVHALVQKLVSGSINEDEFAQKIEEVLKSKHQPGLLPFLKTSVSDLRQHIILQKGLMKQLVEKKVTEKRLQQDNHQSPSPHQSMPTSNQATPTSNQPVQHIDKTASPLANVVSNSQPSSSQLSNTSSANVAMPMLTLNAQQQQLLKQHLSSLPEPQQKIYLEQIKKQFEKQRKAQIQLLLQQKKQLVKQIPNSITTTTTTTQQQQQHLSVLLKQQELIRQQQQATLCLGNQLAHSTAKKVGGASSQVRKPLISLLGRKLEKDDGQSPGKGKTQDEEDDDEGMDIAGVNLKEETAHFLPNVPEAVSHSVSDQTFIDAASLKNRILGTARLYGINDVSDDTVSYLSHAMEERLKNVMEKITVVNQHRMESLKDDSHYLVTSDVRGQLKVLSKIDQISSSRKDEKEKEMIFKAAKSRSKQDDPELAKKKEQARQIQLAQEREIHQKAANETALAAIGRRKRNATTAFGDTSSNSDTLISDTEQTASLPSSNKSSAAVAAVFSSPGPSRNKQKRKLQAKDVIFVMEQEQETKKSLLMYKSFIN